VFLSRMGDAVRLRVVIAEDHYLMREGIRELLAATGSVDVVASVGSAPELIAAVEDTGPDAVLTDIRMPPGHATEGIQAARHIRALHPAVGVVVLSQYADPMYALELFRAGTAGLAYLLKDRIGEVEELLRALREVRSGGSVIDPKVVEGLLARRARHTGAGVTLTPRERDVLAEMAGGRNNAGIAKSLVLSQSAVEKHVNAIFSKLGLTEAEDTHRRVAAVLAYLGGLADPAAEQ
jgi:DNA-binding NarL/FixJ family response regulator